MRKLCVCAAFLLASLLSSVFGISSPANAADAPVSGAAPLPPVNAGGECGPKVPAFTVAKGYRVSLVIDGTEARFMEFDSFSNLYLSAPKKGTITTFKAQPDGTYKKIAAVVTGKKTVHGMDFFDGTMWFTTSGGIFKGKVREDGTQLDDVTTIIPEDGTLPSGGGHWWRPILVDNDGFYTGIGDPQNLSDQAATDREKIWRYSLDGKTKKLFCSGTRNTEKLRFRPGTEEVWGCDHGSDNFGYLIGDKRGDQPITDHIPGEEINHYEQGKFYGHPFVVDANLIRPEYYNLPNIQEIKDKSVPPVFMLPAHFADNGWTWLHKDNAFGKTGDICVASHGSWDSSLKVGYCVSIVHFDENAKPTHAERIVSCIDGQRVLGRPVDAIEEPGTGALLFSVDEPAGRVYRLEAVSSK